MIRERVTQGKIMISLGNGIMIDYILLQSNKKKLEIASQTWRDTFALIL